MNPTQAGKSGVGQSVSRDSVLTDSSTDRLTDSRARTARLRRAIANLRAAGTEGRHTQEPGRAEGVDLTPKSAHEAITRQMVTDLAADVAEIKSRVNAVLWLVAGAVVVDVVMRLAGVG
jgi:hypothetical protein